VIQINKIVEYKTDKTTDSCPCSLLIFYHQRSLQLCVTKWQQSIHPLQSILELKFTIIQVQTIRTVTCDRR